MIVGIDWPYLQFLVGSGKLYFTRKDALAASDTRTYGYRWPKTDKEGSFDDDEQLWTIERA